MPEICTVYVQNCTNRTLVLSGYGDKSSPTRGSTYQMNAWAFGSILPLYVEPFGVGFSDQSHDEDDSATAIYSLAGSQLFRIDGYSTEQSGHYLQVETVGFNSYPLFAVTTCATSAVHTAPASSISWHPVAMPSGVIYPIGTITADGINMGVAIVDLEVIFSNPTDMNTYMDAITAGTLDDSQLATLQQLVAQQARTINPSSWMTDNNALLGPLALNQIAIPGSHDAGMSTLTQCSVGAFSNNTQTQAYNIGGQLAAGSRYFDLRPLLWTALPGSIYLGHFSAALNSPFYVGCAGQALGPALSEIVRFLNQPGCEKEIVILNFSHTLSLNDDYEGTDFIDAQWAGLVTTITESLSGNLYTASGSTPNQNTLTVNDLVASGGRVIAVFDGIPSDQVAPSNGIFQYASYNSSNPGSLTMYNEFADTDNLGDMESDQLGKFKKYCNPSQWLFLLSWTMTWQLDDIDQSIYTMAMPANYDLNPKLNGAVAPLMIEPGRIPNILYVDYTDATYNIPSLCLYLAYVNLNQVP
jgi:hypothetical protein